jgi:hypothetical protein
MGFIDELKKLTRPYDEDEDEFEDFEPQQPAERVTARPKATTPPQTHKRKQR